MLLRMWIEKNIHPLLMDVQTLIASMEISVVVPREDKNWFTTSCNDYYCDLKSYWQSLVFAWCQTMYFGPSFYFLF